MPLAPLHTWKRISVKMYVFISASVLALWNLRKCWRYPIGLCRAFRGQKLRQLQTRWQQAGRIPADPASTRQCQYVSLRAKPRPASIMKQDHVDLEAAYRDQWFALLDKNGVPRPVALQVIAVPGIVVQLTKGEPAGSLDLDESPGNVLMVNLSPVQALQQVRNQR